MRSAIPLLALAASVALTTLSAAQPLPAAPEPLDPAPTLFRDVNVVTITDAGTLERHSVLVQDGRIARIAPVGDLDAPDGVRVIEGGGQTYLIPGLCDMHVHFPPLPGDANDAAWRTATLLVANGVTTARGMIGHPTHIELRRRALDGEFLGPTLYIAGPPLVHQMFEAPQDAAAAVKSQKELGFDFIKSHRIISKDHFDAIQAAAEEHGIPVTGHVDNEVGLEHAVASGMQMEHLDGWLAAMLRLGVPATFGQIPMPHVKGRFDESRIPAIAQQVAQARRWSTPTLALFRRIADTTTPTDDLLARPEIRYILPQAREVWAKQRDAMAAQGPMADRELAGWFVATRDRIVVALRDSGAPLLAGSDSPQAFLVTGSALGLTPDFGRVAEGLRADLVLLRADPTRDIAATRQIDGVMLRGRWLDRPDLDALLADVERSVTPEN